MNYSIAIYPDGAPAKASGYEGARRWERYMEEAAGAGFDEVFLSLHLPEFTVSEQLELLCDVAGKARALGQSLTVDVGGGQLEELLASENYCEQIRQAGVDFIRLDYGYTMEQVRGIWKRWAVKGFVLNASTYREEELVSMQREFLAVDENIQLRACHNYYPRPESGLSYHFFLQQNEIFYRLGIPVYSCIPDDENPRGPVREGLPTVETHRRMGLEQVVRQLAASPANTGLMAADEYFAPEKLVRIRRAAEEERRLLERSLESSLESPQESSQERILELAFFPAEGATEEELGLVYAGTHHIRYDSNDQVLRSQSSRQMSEYAGQVAPRPACPRPAGTVTVDNSLYGRYSGEVEIVMEDLPADRRVNCVGQAAEEDLWKQAVAGDYTTLGLDDWWEDACDEAEMEGRYYPFDDDSYRYKTNELYEALSDDDREKVEEILGVKGEDYVDFTCGSGGRCFSADTKWDLILRPDLVELINKLEG